ncbi:MAG: DUF3102 domain-containing protein [Dethiobacter sp.]|nr:DUF3102 domain-containing protein [Dethiobacter sp.]MBS3898690.1 DUF3102 domain-containing protein [Dethiobacter sp.]
MSMNDLSIERTPQVIAVEINSIKRQAQVVVVQACVEIGRRLVEAKELVPHGDWRDWLERNVDYSKSTANNLMRIYEEYGNNQLSLFGGANLQALGNLTYTQVVALLGVPSHEREQFVEENDVESMSTRELQQVIKERDEAKRRLREVEENTDEIMNELQAIRDEAKKVKETEDKLKKELKQLQKLYEEASAVGNNEQADKLQSALIETDKQLKEANKKISDLEAKLKEKPVDVPATKVVEKVPEAVEKELDELRNKVVQFQQKAGQPEALLKFKVRFDTVVAGFKDLLVNLDEIKVAQPEAYEKYHGAVTGLLNKMLGSL